MTYPVDDAGNPRVDFVWGNLPMQPDDQRLDDNIQIIAPNGDQNRGWSGTEVYASAALNTTEYVYLSIGDQSYDDGWSNPDTREIAIAADSHNIATTGWSNFPGFIPNYSGDGDTGLEAVVPNVYHFTSSAAQAAIQGAGFVYASTDTYVGATVVNDGTVKSQSPIAGSTSNAGSTVTATFYNAPEVPNILNKTEAAATTDLTNAHLVKGTVGTTWASATVANNGKVATQSIIPGTTVDTGTTVNFDLYDAPEVPDVIDLTEAAAETALIAAHLVKGTVTGTYDGATVENDGTVKSSDPVADTTVDTDSSVDLEVYNAPEVPDLLGLTEPQANSALTAVSLVTGTVTTTDTGATTVNDGTVESQSIAADTTVDAGTSVDFVLYEAPTVPDVIGLTEAAAESALNAVNLVKGDVTFITFGATAENDGLVQSQGIVPGTKVDPSTEVDLVLYLYTP